MKALLWIDRRMCLGTGLCEAMSPELFVLADDNLAQVIERHLHDDDRVELARSVAECCPSGAIVVSAEAHARASEEGTGS
ncbi:ferredoxin [Streptosporangium sp. NPDC001559]|uniref:ferredoxin n=1 Tax=Streptosporangium sp. NPDC001559 TaxID=3366187 RepID=UPI0036EDE0AF